uniref:Carboxyvinyl-carboxyphosphonate phosphorylmutase n=1 Tax=Leersia perrieri TaxID=77586 RepID=A0A0D9XXK7_9ORYZ
MAEMNGNGHHGNGNNGAETKLIRTRVERMIRSEGAVLMPGVYDALSAAIVQKTGFYAGFISGYAVSGSLLGTPDVGLLTPPEMAEVARRICASAPDTLFIADADTGGGNALNVKRTVQDLMAAGAAGCFLEVIPAEEHAVKIAAAREVVGDRDFFIVARTDARSVTGLDDAIRRANLYIDAGADACFVEAPRSDEELMEICKRTKGYRVCNMLEGGKTPLHTRQELMEMGFHLIKSPLTTVYATARALVDVLSALKRAETTRDELHRLTSFTEFNNLVGIDSWLDIEDRFSVKTSVPKPLPAPETEKTTATDIQEIKEKAKAVVNGATNGATNGVH